MFGTDAEDEEQDAEDAEDRREGEGQRRHHVAQRPDLDAGRAFGTRPTNALPVTLLGAYATRKQTIACSQMQGSTHQLGLAQRMDLLSNGGWGGGGLGKESDTMGFKGFNRHVE